MKKNLTLLLLLLISILAISACSSSNGNSAGSDDDFPSKDITLMISYEAGGGTDVGARILAPYIEEELGVNVSVVNKPGGAGWTGWTELAKSKPDGYTIGYINSPNIITGYLDPNLKREEDLDSFTMLANHVKDPAIIAIHPDEDRFSNIEELFEYAKSNEITATTGGIGSNDHYALLNLQEKYGLNITPVHTEGGRDASVKVIGGHVDVLVAKVGETLQLYENGEVEILAVMDETRSDFIPDIETLTELGYPDVYSRSSRGIAGPADLSPEVAEKLSTALEKAIKNEEHVEQMAEMGLQVDFKNGEDYLKVLKADEAVISESIDLLEN